MHGVINTNIIVKKKEKEKRGKERRGEEKRGEKKGEEKRREVRCDLFTEHITSLASFKGFQAGGRVGIGASLFASKPVISLLTA